MKAVHSMRSIVYDIISEMVESNSPVTLSQSLLLSILTQGVNINSLSKEELVKLLQKILIELETTGNVIYQSRISNIDNPTFGASLFGTSVPVTLKNSLGIKIKALLIKNIDIMILPEMLRTVVPKQGTVLQKLMSLDKKFIIPLIFSISDFAYDLDTVESAAEIKDIDDLEVQTDDDEFILFFDDSSAFIYYADPNLDGEPRGVKALAQTQELEGLYDKEPTIDITALAGFIDISKLVSKEGW